MTSLPQKRSVGRPKKNQNQSQASAKPDLTGFPCDYCKKVFVTERGVLAHLCDKKRRVLQRGDRDVTLGLQAYQRFWKQKQNPKHLPHWEEFEKSSLYAAFVKFGRHLININPENPLGYVDFLLRNDVGIDDWCKNIFYETYIRERNKLETPSDALERNLMLMAQWADHNQENWFDFFRKVSTNQAVLWIMSGRISPWILLTAPSVEQLMERLTDEQKNEVSKAIDEKFWDIKMNLHRKEVDAVIATLTDEGL